MSGGSNPPGLPSLNAGAAPPGPIPRWDLSSIYPSFDSPEYRKDREGLNRKIALLPELLAAAFTGAEGLLSFIRAYEDAGDTAENLSSYAEAVYTADTRDSRALGEINALEAACLPLEKTAVLFRGRLTEEKAGALRLAETDEALKPYRFFIAESLQKAAFQMSPEMEDLANDLSRSGGGAWSRLHGAVSSTLSVVWESGTGERKTVAGLRDLAHSPDRALRERAYRAELAAWKSAEIPLAAALNGVKGTSITLDKRRGWTGEGFPGLPDRCPSGGSPGIGHGQEDRGGRAGTAGFRALRKSAFQSRISEKTLAALIGALESSLPLFRRYLKAKASLLGIGVCAFYDLFAPLGASAKTWAWEETAAFVEERFTAFDPRMGDFARRAFAASWIDAEGREGKVGGAYCTGFPLAGESRILCNFEGSFDSVTTVAHELGHAWHHELIKDLPRTLSQYPMTLAETASIFAETLVFEGALKKAGPGERLGLIEGNLKDSCQVVVDILSRYYFEKALFERRDRGELGPEELCAIMVEAQEKTYGDGLDRGALHPYMWAVKSHYYSPSLAFYNYPYAFGLLFSLGLYARAQEEGPPFAAAYGELLRLTGQASAEDAACSAGFDITGETFWQSGITALAKRAEEFETLTKETI
jgi:oligoendopeptidase F